MKTKMPGFIAKQFGDRAQALGRQTLDTASNIRTVADQLRGSVLTEKAAELADVAASTAEQVGSYMQSSDLDTMLGDAETFSRERPWTVIIGGFIVGLSVSRVLKAGAVLRTFRATYGTQ